MRKLALALLVSFALPTAASSSAPAEVNRVFFTSTGAVVFHTDVVRTDVPACGATQATRWAIDPNTAAGKIQLTGLLMAHSTGKKVEVGGTNTCNIWGDTESVSYLLVY